MSATARRLNDFEDAAMDAAEDLPLADGWQGRRMRLWAIQESIRKALSDTSRAVPADAVLAEAAVVILESPMTWREGLDEAVSRVNVTLGLYRTAIAEIADPKAWAARLEAEGRDHLNACGGHLRRARSIIDGAKDSAGAEKRLSDAIADASDRLDDAVRSLAAADAKRGAAV